MVENGIEAAVDLRSFPKSRHPPFTRESLERTRPSAGAGYGFLGKELGGFRKEGYEAYLKTGSFHDGLEKLEAFGTGGRTVFLCAERFPRLCRRRRVAQRLALRGWQVVHVLGREKTWVPGEGGNLSLRLGRRGRPGAEGQKARDDV